MFRNFVISQLTQSSTWFGIIIVTSAFLLPRSAILFIGVLVMVNDDARIQKAFAAVRKWLESWWTA